MDREDDWPPPGKMAGAAGSQRANFSLDSPVFAQDRLELYILGLIIAYFGISSLHVLNQNLVYRLSVQARSRINAIYMTCYFSGAGLGAFLSLNLWKMYGWSACVLLGCAFALLILR